MIMNYTLFTRKSLDVKSTTKLLGYKASNITFMEEADSNGAWGVVGNNGTTPYISYSLDSSTWSTTSTNLSSKVVSVGYTNGYIVLIKEGNVNSGQCLLKCQTTLPNLSSSSTFYTSSYPASTPINPTDLVCSNNKCTVSAAFTNTGSPGGHIYVSDVANSFTAPNNYATRWAVDSTYPYQCCLAGSKVVLMGQNGSLTYCSSVGAQYEGGNPDRLDSDNTKLNYLVAGTITGITTSRVGYYNGYLIVAGSKSDGTYIWYSSDTLGNSMTWTEKKISSNVGTVIGVGYSNGKYIVSYYYNNDINFWISARNNIQQDFATDYTSSDLSTISSNEFIMMKSYNNNVMLVSYDGTDSNVTKITL